MSVALTPPVRDGRRRAADEVVALLAARGLAAVPAGSGGAPRALVDAAGLSRGFGATRRSGPSIRAGRVGSGFGGGPSFGRPSASNFPSWQGQA